MVTRVLGQRFAQALQRFAIEQHAAARLSSVDAELGDTLAQAGCDVAGCGLESTDSEGEQHFVVTVEGHGRRAFYQSLDISDANRSGRAGMTKAKGDHKFL